MELRKEKRLDELKDIFSFIINATPSEIAHIINEIIVCHSNLIIFDMANKSLYDAESVCINGECVQINTNIQK